MTIRGRRTWRIHGRLVPCRLRTEQAVGRVAIGDPGAPYEFIDRVCLRDTDGRPFVPATSLAGVLSALARASLMARGIDPRTSSAFRGLFGEAAATGGGGQEARVTVRDGLAPANGSLTTLVRDRNAVDRKRGAAADKRLFKDEAVHAGEFKFEVEFRETGPRTDAERTMAGEGQDPDVEAWRLLLDAVDLLARGWASVGGQFGSGAGRVRLDEVRVQHWDRSDPGQFFAFATGRWGALRSDTTLDEALAGTEVPAWWSQSVSPPRVPERILFSCRLRPLEPLLVRSGFTSEMCEMKGASRPAPEGAAAGEPAKADKRESVDQAFPLGPDGHPYVPGSSVRGALRNRAERAVRTVACDGRKAWDLDDLQRHALRLRQLQHWNESDISCLVTQTFGFEQLGGRIAFSDAVPEHPDEFDGRRKLLDHVAIDRFSGGAADQQKFNERPYIPRLDEELVPDGKGDLFLEIDLFDFELRHLGLLLLLLRDLALKRVRLGASANNGMGKVDLVDVRVSVLTADGGLLWPGSGIPAGDKTAGFSIFEGDVTWAMPAFVPQADVNGWSELFMQAVDTCRAYLQTQPVDAEEAR